MEIGHIKPIDIDEEMQASYLSYAMSVIISRALPDARDGLKPVHRRILYAMYDMGINPQSSHKKSARIVGEVLGKYHPHGDQAVYDAMARMTQTFSMRSTLLDGQGNFGSMDGDTPAAMRYTEARLHPISTQLLTDIRKNTVDFISNFDDTLQEPVVLPAAFPNLMVNGSTGIAVGMSTSVPPHNLSEVCGALALMLENWTNLDKIQVQDLMQHIKGPDFPTGGLVITHAEEDVLASAYGSGRGKITVRARIHVEELARGRQRLIVTELPYQTNKASLISRIASLARENRITGITDLRDESDRQGMRIVIDLNKSADPDTVLKQLFKLTLLQTTFSIILLALVNGEPRLLTLKQALRVFLEHRIEVVRRRSQFDLKKAKDRAYLISGLLVALDNIDEVISLIRNSKDVPTARKALMDQYDLSTTQANAILDMPLRQLAQLQRNILKDEYKDLMTQIEELQSLLRSPTKVREVVSLELRKVSGKYSDNRRTHIITSSDSQETISANIIVPDEDSWVVLTQEGTLSRINNTRRPALTGYTPLAILRANTRDILYLIAIDGTASAITVGSIPIASNPRSGVLIDSVSAMTNKSVVVAALSINPLILSQSDRFLSLFLATAQGGVKRLLVNDLPGPSASLFKLIKIGANDRLASACWITSSQNALVFTAEGKGIRFDSNIVRTTGLSAGSVQGIRLGHKHDHIITCTSANENTEICLVSQNGKAKRAVVSQFPLQGRGGRGVQACKLDAGQRLSGAVEAVSDSEIVIITSKRKAYAVKVTDVPLRGRSAAGSQILELPDKEKITGMILCQQILQHQTKKSVTVVIDKKTTDKRPRTRHNKTRSTKNQSNKSPSATTAKSKKKTTSKKVSQRVKDTSKSPKIQKNKQIPLFKAPK